MYQHAKSQGIDILSIYTGDDNQYTPFTLALAQLDNKLPDTSPALEREVSRQEDCAKLIKALVDEGYNPDTVSDRMVPLAIYDSK